MNQVVEMPERLTLPGDLADHLLGYLLDRPCREVMGFVQLIVIEAQRQKAEQDKPKSQDAVLVDDPE